MSNHARRRRNAATANVRVCAATTRTQPCTRLVEYTIDLAYDACAHAIPPLEVCHPHAYTFQARPRDPNLSACQICGSFAHITLVRVTRALEAPA